MDYYSILGVDAGASGADIKRAYRRLARRYHPASIRGTGRAGVVRADLEAYETLIDPERRRRYDAGRCATAVDAEARRSSSRGSISRWPRSVAQAATFSELFADVLHPRPGARIAAGRKRGADLHAR